MPHLFARASGAALASLLVAAAAAAPAGASMSVSITGGFANVTEKPSQPNQSDNIGVTDTGTGRYRFQLAGGNVTTISTDAPAFCTVFGDHVDCDADDLLQFLVSLGGGNDSFSNLTGVPVLALGGAGADTVTGGSGKDIIEGGSEDDTLSGGPESDLITDDGAFLFSNAGAGGNDSLGGDGGNDTLDGGTLEAGVIGATTGGGHDLMDGGDGTDTADYSQRTGPLTITVDSPGYTGNFGNDGEVNEHDNVIHVEHLIGGSGADTMIASGYSTTIEGRSGADAINGADGDDTLLGGDGGDQIAGNDGGDTIDPGRGSDIVSAGAAADNVDALDGYADSIDCGPGDDTVTADSFDTVNADCEHVTRAAAPPSTTKTVTVKVPTPVPPKPGPVFVLPTKLKADAKGRVQLKLVCPASTKTGCLFGKLTVATAPKSGKAKKAGSASFSAKPGKTAKITVKLSSSARRTLARKHKLAVTLTAVALNGDAQSRTTKKALTIKR